ncbi:MAG: MbcA/ParS/Xre antitoxin family protein [Candidatus Polarisedimenticolaceae bacterium]|nr:MbcA/ParS/Xre antitoxin family protein [Candidatus Polarisedimenticolaceae bacterium]
MAKKSAPVASLNWQKMRATEGELVHILLKHAERHYGSEAVAEAWDEFSLWNEVPMDPETEPELDTVFLPWFLFNWIPGNAEVDAAKHLPEMQVAMHYLKRKGPQVDSFHRRFIEEACSQPYSFFQVTDADPDRSLLLKDILLGREVTVHEHQASTILHRGDAIFTRIITMDDVSIMVGGAPAIIPPRYLNDLIGMRERMAEVSPGFGRELLEEYDIELRSLYYEIREEIYNPPLPQMQNTDGDPLQLTKLYYGLQCTPREALDALASLSMMDVDELISEGKFNEQGELTSIEFPWLKKGNAQQKSWDNTVMGHITINDGQLTVDVNSQQRADAVKRKITRRLGERAVFRNAVIQSVEKMLEDSQDNPAAMLGKAEPDDDLMAHPEIQEKIKEMADRHWKEWLDSPIPALKDQTPRDAAKSSIGRERLEALLLQFEQRVAGDAQPFAPDVDALRRSLGLT